MSVFLDLYGDQALEIQVLNRFRLRLQRTGHACIPAGIQERKARKDPPKDIIHSAINPKVTDSTRRLLALLLYTSLSIQESY